MRKKKLNHTSNISKKVDDALILLQRLYFDLTLSPRTLTECKSLVHKYYMKNPESKLKSSTIVGSIVYIVSMRNSEHISLSAIADKLEISASWLAKNKKRIASELGFSSPFYQ